MDKEVHEAFYGKYNGIFRACTSSVYQASPWGEGPGDEAICDGARLNLVNIGQLASLARHYITIKNVH